MTITIRDQDFATPGTLNQLDCISADRFLERVDESVSIIQVCQDAQNPSLVIVTFSLVGAFLFTPYCKILEVDGNTSYELNDVTAPIAIGHYRNNDIPINTNCRTVSPEIVFDFGRVIPNFLSAHTIKFLVGMIGTVPLGFGVTFPNQTPTVTHTWSKGVLPRPVALTYQNNSLFVTFEYNGSHDCSCNIQCIEPSGVNFPLSFCPNETQGLSFQTVLSGDPYSLVLQLEDSIGNRSSLNINTVYQVNPAPPYVGHRTGPIRNEISISNLSVNGKDVGTTDYQIIKFIGTVGNHYIWKDWSERPTSYFIDRDIIPNTTYGYSVRYKGKFGDISNLSDWTIVNT